MTCSVFNLLPYRFPRTLCRHFSPSYFFPPSTWDCLELHCEHRTPAERHGAISGASPCLCLIFAGHFRSLGNGLTQGDSGMSQLVLIFLCRKNWAAKWQHKQRMDVNGPYFTKLHWTREDKNNICQTLPASLSFQSSASHFARTSSQWTIDSFQRSPSHVFPVRLLCWSNSF